MNGTIPKGSTEPVTVKFANNPSNNKSLPPLAAYLTPQTARRFAGPMHHPNGRFRLKIYLFYFNFFEFFFIFSYIFHFFIFFL